MYRDDYLNSFKSSETVSQLWWREEPPHTLRDGKNCFPVMKMMMGRVTYLLSLVYVLTQWLSKYSHQIMIMYIVVWPQVLRPDWGDERMKKCQTQTDTQEQLGPNRLGFLMEKKPQPSRCSVCLYSVEQKREPKLLYTVNKKVRLLHIAKQGGGVYNVQLDQRDRFS